MNEVASPLRDAPWLAAGVEHVALDWAVTEGCPASSPTREQVTAGSAQVRRLVRQRLTRRSTTGTCATPTARRAGAGKP